VVGGRSRPVFRRPQDLFPALLNIHRKHEQAAVLPLDLDHAWITGLSRTYNLTIAPVGTVTAVGLAISVVNSKRVGLQSEILTGTHRSSRASGSGPNHGSIDSAENYVSPEWLPNESKAFRGIFNVARNQYYGDAGDQVFDRVRQIHAIEVPRHLNVGDHQINLITALLQDSESIYGVLCLEALNPFTLQKGTEVGADCWFVVNDKTQGLIHTSLYSFGLPSSDPTVCGIPDHYSIPPKVHKLSRVAP
jgi:hypothetical protein